MLGDRTDRDLETLDPSGVTRPAAVARARALVADGAWVGSYVLAGAILDATPSAGRAGRLWGSRA